MFAIGFFIGALSGVLFPNSVSIYIFIAIGVALGILLAALSNKFHKMQLFTVNFFMALSALNSILIPLFAPHAAIGAALLLSVGAGLIAMKLKYIVTIITSSWLGAVQTTAALLHLLSCTNLFISAGVTLVLAAAGMGLQFWQEKMHAEKHAAKHNKNNEPPHLNMSGADNAHSL